MQKPKEGEQNAMATTEEGVLDILARLGAQQLVVQSPPQRPKGMNKLKLFPERFPARTAPVLKSEVLERFGPVSREAQS